MMNLMGSNANESYMGYGGNPNSHHNFLGSESHWAHAWNPSQLHPDGYTR